MHLSQLTDRTSIIVSQGIEQHLHFADEETEVQSNSSKISPAARLKILSRRTCVKLFQYWAAFWLLLNLEFRTAVTTGWPRAGLYSPVPLAKWKAQSQYCECFKTATWLNRRDYIYMWTCFLSPYCDIKHPSVKWWCQWITAVVTFQTVFVLEKSTQIWYSVSVPCGLIWIFLLNSNLKSNRLFWDQSVCKVWWYEEFYKLSAHFLREKNSESSWPFFFFLAYTISPALALHDFPTLLHLRFLNKLLKPQENAPLHDLSRT